MTCFDADIRTTWFLRGFLLRQTIALPIVSTENRRWTNKLMFLTIALCKMLFDIFYLIYF